MKILHLDDNPADAELVGALLRAEFPSCSITAVQTRESFLAGLAASTAPDIIISDNSLPELGGFAALEIVRERAPDIPLIFLSGTIGEERAIATIRAGAYDYVLKDNMARLPTVIRRALDDFALRRRNKEGERRLVELAEIIERSTEAIVVADLSGCITLWNNGAARLYGLNTADALGRRSEEIFSDSELAHVRAAREATHEDGDWQRELSINTRDGRKIIIDLRMSLVRDDAGRPIARLSIATDITEKKQREEQFLHAQRFESIGMLAAGIAHDLNNVLAPILFAAPLLRGSLSTPRDLKILDTLERSAGRGAGLVKQIVGFAHNATGELQPTQVRHLLRDIIDLIEETFPKSIQLEHHIPSDLRLVLGNATQIHQVLLNLCVNARDAMPQGGTLRIAAFNRQLNAEEAGAIPGAQSGAWLVLEVADTGTGIPPEVLERIWTPFFTTKGSAKGTGLGLSTVRGIVVNHHGFTELHTEVSRGTTFRVFLPAVESESPHPSSATPFDIPDGHGELILLVDDDAPIRDIGTAILENHGYRVVNCADGVEAIILFISRAEEISLVITDVDMPRLGGTELARVLSRIRPDIRLLAISGMPSKEINASDVSAAKKVTHAFLLKPFKAEDLLGTVHRLIHPSPAD
jgi:PAS domain S-box-containing protein